MKFLATAIIGILLLGGCTWVKPTPGGSRVRVVYNPAEITSCKKLGDATVSLLDRVGYIRRNQAKVEQELTTLGRNSAAEMGGDTILPVSAIENGERTFSVYRCGGF